MENNNFIGQMQQFMEAYNQKFLEEMVKIMEKKFKDSEISMDKKLEEQKESMRKDF